MIKEKPDCWGLALTLDTPSSQVWMRDRSLRWSSAAGPEEWVGDEEGDIRSCSSVPGWASSVRWSSSRASRASGSPGGVSVQRVFISRMSSCLSTAWSSACRALKLTAPLWVPIDKFNKSIKLMFSDILVRARAAVPLAPPPANILKNVSK